MDKRPAQLCRRYNLSRWLVDHWKKQYSRGRLNNEPSEKEALLGRIGKLEQMLGKLTLENEFLKKSLAEHSKGTGEKREFISAYQELIGGVRKGCELMRVSRNTFYYKPEEKSLQKLQEDMDIQDEIEKICLEFPRYG